MTTEGRHVVAAADIKVSAIYDFEAEKAGLSGFWIGKAIGYYGATTVKAEVKARGYSRAMAMATIELGNQALIRFPPGSP